MGAFYKEKKMKAKVIKETSDNNARKWGGLRPPNPPAFLEKKTIWLASVGRLLSSTETLKTQRGADNTGGFNFEWSKV